jgi:hypothetical protein
MDNLEELGIDKFGFAKLESSLCSFPIALRYGFTMANPGSSQWCTSMTVARNLNEVAAGRYHQERDTRFLFLSCSPVMDRSS